MGMKMKSGLVLLFSFLLGFSSYGQKNLDVLATDVMYYSDIVANTLLPSSKTKANESLVMTMEEFLGTSGSFNYSFEQSPWISIKECAGNTMKVYSWEVKKGEDDYAYFGYIQKADGTFVTLSDQSSDIEDAAYMDLDVDYWYGALYYNVLDVTDADGNLMTILFGINKKDRFTTTKVAEVIQIKSDKIAFGSPIFEDKENTSWANRIYQEYSADANGTLNYSEGLGMIIFDNLIPRMGAMEGQGPTKYPDGSYKGYQWKEGKFEYVDKIYDYISDTPPNLKKSVPRKEKRDIFGKKN